MKSVGEAMAIGRTFKESFQKAMRSLEIGLKGFEAGKLADQKLDKSAIRAGVKRPSAERPTFLYKALEIGMTPEQISKQSGIDLWFTSQLGQIHQIRQEIGATTLLECDEESFREAKEAGFSDRQLADAWGCEPSEVRERRSRLASKPPSGWSIPAPRNSKPSSLLLFLVRGRERDEAVGFQEDYDPWGRAQPDRAGHRIRLLLCPCFLRPARSRV